MIHRRSLPSLQGLPLRLVVALALGLVLAGNAAARATVAPRATSVAPLRVSVSEFQAISGYSPFKPNGCGVPGKPTYDSEAEPSIAVNPANPQNIVAVWQQDRFAVDGGALSNIVGVSQDGGRTWRHVLVPGISRCTGGPDERTSDPWVSIGPDGAAYLATLTFTENPTLGNAGLAGPTNQLVSRSLNGGLTWAPPVTVVADGAYNDREAITADPFHPGRAYEAWVNRLGAFGETGVNELVTTNDAGRTFSAPASTYTAAPTNLPDPTLIEVLPDGTLVDVFMLANTSAVVGPPVPFKVMAMRSTDGGASWSTPVTIAQLPPQAPYDSDTNVQVRAYPAVSAATARDGTVYAVWNDISSAGSAAIRLSRSSDHGRTWSAPVAVRTLPAQAFLPSVAVDRQGVVGVTWDDFRHHRAGSKHLETDVWFAGSVDGGRHFRESHLAGPFDAAAASSTSSTSVSGRFLGDYQGLAALPSGFVADFAMSGGTRGPSDVFFARISVARPAIVLTVTPRRSFARRATLFRFRVVGSPSAQPVRGVLIRFAGHRLRTGALGRARVRLRLRPGRYAVIASAPGLAPGRATVIVNRR